MPALFFQDFRQAVALVAIGRSFSWVPEVVYDMGRPLENVVLALKSDIPNFFFGFHWAVFLPY